MAVMASEIPIDPVGFPEKAQPLPVSDNSMASTPEVNGNSVHYDALFDDTATQQNGTNNLNPNSTSTMDQEADGASKTLAAEDKGAAPVEHVEAGIAPVASYLPNHAVESANITSEPLSTATEPIATTTEPPPVEQPVSDAREEPMPEAPEPLAQAEPAAMEPISSVALDTTSLNAVAQPNLNNVDESADAMDTGEDSSPVVQNSDAQALIDDPMPSIEPTVSDMVTTIPAEHSTPSAQQTSLTTGQVRPREEDEDEEPAAKRAKTETMEDDPISAAQDIPIASTESAPDAQPQDVMASASATYATDSAPSKASVSIDSSPMTPIQQKFLLEQIRKAKKTKSALAFLQPVDWSTLNLPTYPQIVKTPMDISTMESKLKAHQYGSADDLMADFELIVQNSITFNGQAHAVSQAGLSLKAYFVKCVSMLPKGPAASAEPKTKKQSPAPKPATRDRRPAPTPKSPVTEKVPAPTPHTSILNEHGMPFIRRDTNTLDDRPKRAIVPPKRDLPPPPRPKSKKSQLELKFCELVIAEISKKKYQAFAYAFMYPVDPVALNIPTYHRIIKKPMDFGTISNNLKNGQYSNAKEFYADSMLVFNNCYKFNPPADDVYKMGKQLQAVFDDEWEKKDEWMANNRQPSEPATEDEEEDEEEEVVEDPQIRRMQEIQAQIAALSAEALQLTQVPSKRPSPKVTGKTKTPKAAPVKAKRSSNVGLPGASKAAKVKAKPKPRKLTLEQKREVSDGIANLDEAKMRKAVQIIRNGVPALANVQDDELELDIDEIPEDVVIKLWEFVRASMPKKPREPSPDYEDDDEDEYAAKPSTQRKKNKPMKAREQEERIQQLQAKLLGLQGSGSEQSPADRNEESDEDASESSEEE